MIGIAAYRPCTDRPCAKRFTTTVDEICNEYHFNIKTRYYDCQSYGKLYRISMQIVAYSKGINQGFYSWLQFCRSQSIDWELTLQWDGESCVQKVGDVSS